MKEATSYLSRGSFIPFSFLIFSILLFTQCHLSKPDDLTVLDAIKKGDDLKLNSYLKKGIDINREYGPDGITLLNWAITNDQLTAAYLLIDKGADIELKSEGKTPLMYTSRFNRPEIAKLLISRGAGINNINDEANTAFHYAARYNNLEMLQLLYNYGADIAKKNEDSWTALDFARMNSKEEIARYLENIGVPTFPKAVPDSFEGPHIFLSGANKITSKYISHDSLENSTAILSHDYSFQSNSAIIQGVSPDSFTYRIRTEENIPLAVYESPSKIFAMGDIHGQYKRMVKMLKSGGVIDDNLNWIWGDGHLVFVGDIFDRGEGVTEALWLIYKLEGQALNHNGRVHLLLGNHELMILNNDIRYLAPKYYGLTSNVNISYNELFSNETILGRWLRTKNCIEIIGNTMFVHAGISPELKNLNLDAEKINSTIRDYLNNPDDTSGLRLKKFLTGNLGPLWYRGNFRSTDQYDIISQAELDEILDHYSAEIIVLGHTEADSIGLINNSRTIHINIPLADNEINEQALLIEKGSYYRVSSDMTKSLIK